MMLTSYHPGVAVEQIKNETGWPLKVSPGVHETTTPTKAELAAVRKYDHRGIWTG
jgi:glutaconate CoA-transferase subunit B